ncbi:MAG: hypothetical protein H0U46_07890 [Actinobacteria bacterium]|nr:hypothetical protein [Actinomycetota bacterium]
MRRRLGFLFIAIGTALIFTGVAWGQTGDAIPDAENIAAWSAITGVMLPWAAAFLLQASWSSQLKAVAVAALCAADAVVVTGFTHGWHFDQHLLISAAGIFALARTSYAGLYVHIGGDGEGAPAIKKFEAATSL